MVVPAKFTVTFDFLNGEVYPDERWIPLLTDIAAGPGGSFCFGSDLALDALRLLVHRGTIHPDELRVIFLDDRDVSINREGDIHTLDNGPIDDSVCIKILNEIMGFND